MFNLMILAQTLSSLFNIASCLFTAAKEPVGSVMFFATLTYFLSMLIEFALVCWFGSEITTASEELMFALYDIDWFSASHRFKKSLLLTMSRMQRPIYLSIGKFFPLTLKATVSVCKASFSYYTVFRRVED
ncbi:odorant receptor 2a-like [Anoplophora glabripennis]|uniref:odorant receptor 2a-like n=1 Tax=Anoplophora glabripennis TaxID=217634 RepID=UPI000C795102|nr:odorant receptor 2a-like [Anoplophora glabripennis]